MKEQLKDLPEKLLKRIDVEGFLVEDVGEALLEPLIIKLADKIKKIIPGQFDDALIDQAIKEQLPEAKEELRELVKKFLAKV